MFYLWADFLGNLGKVKYFKGYYFAFLFVPALVDISVVATTDQSEDEIVLYLAIIEAATHLNVSLVGQLQLVVMRLALHVWGNDYKIRHNGWAVNQVSLMRLMKV